MDREIAIYLLSEIANTERERVDSEIFIRPYLAGARPFHIHRHTNVWFPRSEVMFSVSTSKFLCFINNPGAIKLAV